MCACFQFGNYVGPELDDDEDEDQPVGHADQWEHDDQVDDEQVRLVGGM